MTNQNQIKNQINAGQFARVQSLAFHIENKTTTPAYLDLVLLDKGTPVAMSENVRYDALNITPAGTFRSNVYLEQIINVQGYASLDEVCEMMQAAK